MQINGFTVLISGNYNAFNEGWNGAGIYACSGNYVSQTFKTPWYIGGSIDLDRRINIEHIPFLIKNKHCNNPLQFAWNKHNSNEGFIWILLESCLPEKQIILDLEQNYLNLNTPFANSFNGFNISHSAHGGSFFGEQNPFFGKHHSQETRDKLAEYSRKTHEFISPEGDIIVIENLKEFCLKNNLLYMSMLSVNNDRTANHRGWTKPNAILKLREYKLIDPNGEIHIFGNMKKFCKEYNLNASNMGLMLRGKRNHVGGWRIYSEENLCKYIKQNKKIVNFIVKSPLGEIINGKNMRQFAILNNLDYGAMIKLINGKRKTYKGWQKWQ